MAENILQRPAAKPTVLHSEGRWHVVNLENLVFVEAQTRYKLFYFAGRSLPYKVEATMKSVEADLSAYRDFVPVHRSFIINLKYVCGYDARCAYVYHNGKEYHIPILHKVIEKYFTEMFKT